MDKEHVKGATDKAVDKTKEVAGHVTGNEKLETEGKADQADPRAGKHTFDGGCTEARSTDKSREMHHHGIQKRLGIVRSIESVCRTRPRCVLERYCARTFRLTRVPACQEPSKGLREVP
jgi:uncharacterized protein YjbJ (UPF0337 family)